MECAQDSFSCVPKTMAIRVRLPHATVENASRFLLQRVFPAMTARYARRKVLVGGVVCVRPLRSKNATTEMRAPPMGVTP